MVSFVERIRNDVRETEKQGRKENRYQTLNKNRAALGEISAGMKDYSVAEVKVLANKLKHKREITINLLTTLKSALIQSENNIAAFINVTGAVQCLIRITSGPNSQFKHQAAGCCCNVALGNSKFCHKFTKIASPYLLSSFNELDSAFLDICVWTLGNLAGSDLKTLSLLKSQGVLPKITSLLTSSNDNIVEASVYALSHFVKMGFNNLEPSEITSIAEVVHPLILKRTDVYWLMFLLSCSSECDTIFLNKLVIPQIFGLLLIEQTNWNEKSSPKHTTALLRTLANLCAEETGKGAQQVLHTENSQPGALQSVFTALLTSPYGHIQCEAHWCIANLCKYSKEEQEAYNLVTKLKPYLKEEVLGVMHKQP